ncbi:MAG: 2-aminoethylphosphonate--pyruvate transaminase [Cytophagales bacterium]|nr:2-aminoethylphosphonate--pyruvate transaminase [Cytophagales bacterium]
MGENPYLLLTPGPLSTSTTVKKKMMRDWCTWDEDYNLNVVEGIRAQLISLATNKADEYTSVLLQGSGTFAVEATIGTVVPEDGKVLIISNGAYGDRMALIARVLKIPFTKVELKEQDPITPDVVSAHLKKDRFTHAAFVHCETTTGMLNPAKEVMEVAKSFGCVTILDAMSSFGGIPMTMEDLNADFLISSANKCIQGVPGFGFVIANTIELKKCKARARSLSLDLYDQWETMEKHHGKWRYTSPTHVVRAFQQALIELHEEGGIKARHLRYLRNQELLVKGMEEIGYGAFLKRALQSPIITSFLYPHGNFDFLNLYQKLKKKGFVIYPGKISTAATFRVGTIGEVYQKDIEQLLQAFKSIKTL